MNSPVHAISCTRKQLEFVDDLLNLHAAQRDSKQLVCKLVVGTE